MYSVKWLGFFLSLLLLLQCACGGRSGSNNQPLPPPSGLTYTSSEAVYTQGTTITPNSPTSTGRLVAGDSVSPALPAGLALNPTTGVISGTPTAVTATASYTIAASNSTGSTTAILSITVQVAAPAGSAYTTAAAVYTVATPIPANSPTSTGGAVTAYSVSPDLPAGLSLDDDTGIITGTPAALSAKSKYIVTASNSTGSATATLTISVNAAAAGVQFIPNLNQWITPLAPQGSQFQSLVTPWLANGNPWLAGRGARCVTPTKIPRPRDSKQERAHRYPSGGGDVPSSGMSARPPIRDRECKKPPGSGQYRRTIAPAYNFFANWRSGPTGCNRLLLCVPR